jgi:hypothetical protein
MATLTADDRAHLGTVRPELRAKLAQLQDRMSEYGYTTTVPEYGGLRSRATQAALYADSLEQGGGVLAYPVGAPGKSRHEYGAAFDLAIVGEDPDSAAYATMADAGEGYGLKAGYYFANKDPYHFQLDETLQQSIDAWAGVGSANAAEIAIGALATIGALLAIMGVV